MVSLWLCFDGRHGLWPGSAAVLQSAGGRRSGVIRRRGQRRCAAQPAATDWLQYIASYPDLIRAFGADPAAGERHYQLYGRTEGRSLDLFNESQYLANYADLRAAFGTDLQAATVHYITYGYYEGRTDRASGPATRPNFVVFFVDDLGYGEVGAVHQPDTLTPNIDAIAAAGVVATNGYVTAPLCAPSRAGLLTGRYQQTSASTVTRRSKTARSDSTVACRRPSRPWPRASGHRAMRRHGRQMAHRQQDPELNQEQDVLLPMCHLPTMPVA